MEWDEVDRTKALPLEEHPELIEKLLIEMTVKKETKKLKKKCK